MFKITIQILILKLLLRQLQTNHQPYQPFSCFYISLKDEMALINSYIKTISIFIMFVSSNNDLLVQNPPRKYQNYNNITHTFKQMSNVFKIRERIEQSKKTCLLRKIKFYQYLVSYSTGADYPNSTAYNQSIKSFFPHVNYHTKLNTSSTIKAKMENSTQDTQTNTTETDILPAFQSTISSRSSAKESQKSRVPSRLNNTCSIIAKSMTPSIKTHLSPLKTTRVKMSSFVKRNNFSTISNSDKFEGVHQRQNAKKRSFVNNISYFKQQASTSSAKINYPRKQSIAPWDVGTEDF